MPKKMGRPKIKVDLKQVEALAAIGCTDEEIVIILDISLSTLKNRKNSDADFVAAMKKGKAIMRSSIRRLQMAAAKKGNATMLIWLGKQHLDQTDRPYELYRDGEQSININIRDKAKEEIKDDPR
jgi:hypothetical protein